jgi:hypothetical protein
MLAGFWSSPHIIILSLPHTKQGVLYSSLFISKIIMSLPQLQVSHAVIPEKSNGPLDEGMRTITMSFS